MLPHFSLSSWPNSSLTAITCIYDYEMYVYSEIQLFSLYIVTGIYVFMFCSVCFDTRQLIDVVFLKENPFFFSELSLSAILLYRVEACRSFSVQLGMSSGVVLFHLTSGQAC